MTNSADPDLTIRADLDQLATLFAKPSRVIGKHWRPRSDAAECGVQSGSPQFANTCSKAILIRNI